MFLMNWQCNPGAVAPAKLVLKSPRTPKPAQSAGQLWQFPRANELRFLIHPPLLLPVLRPPPNRHAQRAKATSMASKPRKFLRLTACRMGSPCLYPALIIRGS